MKVNGTEMLVTGGPNGTLGIFDLTVLKQVGEAHGHTAPVRPASPLTLTPPRKACGAYGWTVVFSGGDVVGRTTGLECLLLCERGRVRSIT